MATDPNVPPPEPVVPISTPPEPGEVQTTPMPMTVVWPLRFLMRWPALRVFASLRCRLRRAAGKSAFAAGHAHSAALMRAGVKALRGEKVMSHRENL